MMRQTIPQVFCIAIAGLALGLGSNAARSDRHVKLAKDYFRKLEQAPKPGGVDATTDAAAGDSQTDDDSPAADDDGQAAEDKALEHGFMPVSLDDAAELYMNPGYASGEIVFVDARDDVHFAEAHIPGAIHIDRYNPDPYFERAERALSLADIIVVYCGGGECEDSIYLATELYLERDIPYEKIRLFEGGMQAWEGDNLETEGSDSE